MEANQSSGPQTSPKRPVNLSIMRVAISLTTLILLIFAAFLITDNYRAVVLKLSSPSKRLQLIWRWDLELLDREGSLPVEWNSLKEVKFIAADDISRGLLENGKVAPEIPTDPNAGENRLEARIFSWTEKQDYGVIIQYELFALKGDNKIWELGRTFHVGQDEDGLSNQEIKAASTQGGQ